MEFRPYPPAPQVAGRKSLALCQAQGMLHRDDSLLIPCALLFIAGAAIFYEHATLETYSSGAVRNFLAMIIITMLPLAFLEKKILACAEPVSLISKFSSHVLVLHACFLAARVHTVYLTYGLFTWAMTRPLLAFLFACVILRVCFGCRLDRATFAEHSEALFVLCISVWAAILTEGLEEYRGGDPLHGGLMKFVKEIGDTAALYVELLAFVPAVWMVCRQGTSACAQVDVADTRKRAVAFFAFLLCFYFFEDIVSAFTLARYVPLAAAGHVAHFLLLLDFAGFLLANLYDPTKADKLMGSLKNMWSDACAV